MEGVNRFITRIIYSDSSYTLVNREGDCEHHFIGEPVQRGRIEEMFTDDEEDDQGNDVDVMGTPWKNRGPSMGAVNRRWEEQMSQRGSDDDMDMDPYERQQEQED